jgi:hypothetical protein
MCQITLSQTLIVLARRITRSQQARASKHRRNMRQQDSRRFAAVLIFPCRFLDFR